MKGHMQKLYLQLQFDAETLDIASPYLHLLRSTHRLHVCGSKHFPRKEYDYSPNVQAVIEPQTT
jgi:hypothetical protein